jgi:hypothetical protein
MNIYDHGAEWHRLCEYGLDTDQQVFGENVTRTIFDCGTYSWDGHFNIVKLPQGMSIYHGGGTAANNLAFIPLGANFLNNLARDGPPDAIAQSIPVIERKEAIYPILSQFGGPNPGWYSNPTTADIYARRNDDPTIATNCSKSLSIGGLGITVADCILAFKLMREMTLILIDDPYNIIQLRTLFASVTTVELAELQPLIAAAVKPHSHPVGSAADLLAILSLYFFGSRRDSTGNAADSLTPQLDISTVDIVLDENHAVEHGSQFYLVVGGTRIQHFDRRSGYDWDIAMGTTLCFLLSRRLPGTYDGYGAPYIRSNHHRSWQTPRGTPYFSLELVICDAANIITRDYDNPIDWQNPDGPTIQAPPPEAQRYLDFLDKHVITNYKEYAGNMYENMVWTMLVTEHMLLGSDLKFMGWQQTIAPYGDFRHTAYIGTILAFFYNYRQTFECRAHFPPEDYDISYYSCEENNARFVYTGVLASRSLVNTFSALGGADPTQVYNLISAFLDAAPYIYTYLNGAGDERADETATNILQNVLKTSTQFQNALAPDILNLMIGLGLTVVFASVMTRGSPVGVIPILSAPIQGNRCNLRSVFLPWMSNRSRLYPGVVQTPAEIDTLSAALTQRLGSLIVAIKKIASSGGDQARIQRELTHTVASNAVFDMVIDTEIGVMYDTLFPEQEDKRLAAFDLLERMYVALKAREAEAETHVWTEWNKDHRLHTVDVMTEILKIDVQQELHRVIGLPVGTAEQLTKANSSYYAMWIGYLGKAYKPAMAACNARLTLQINRVPSVDSWRPPNTTKLERVWYILQMLKPIFGAIFETYSVTQYPSLKTYPARYNHNSLNHLRSVWYTALFLANSGFINDLNNMDIFLLLLGSIFKSIGRTDESNAGPSARDYSMRNVLRPFVAHGSLPDQRWPDFHQGCGVDMSSFPMPGTIPISMSIAYQVLCSISNKFPLDQSRYSQTFVFASGIIVNDDLLQYYDTCPDMKNFIDSVSIMSMGHYLDHCRPTTRFSQLDTATNPVVPNNPFTSANATSAVFNEPKGPAWLKFLLERYDFQNDGWNAFKEFWFEKQVEVLERTGFQRMPGGSVLQEHARGVAMGAIPSIEVDWGQRCNTLFESRPTVDLVTLAGSFDQAWNAIFTPQSLWDQA